MWAVGMWQAMAATELYRKLSLDSSLAPMNRTQHDLHVVCDVMSTQHNVVVSGHAVTSPSTLETCHVTLSCWAHDLPRVSVFDELGWRASCSHYWSPAQLVTGVSAGRDLVERDSEGCVS